VTALLLGFVLGLRHALDADHVVAVATIVSRERSLRGAARIGALWGAGHSATVFVAGGALVALRVVVPPRLALAFEFLVALMLITLGVLHLLRPPHDRVPLRIHPALVGVIHGLAGTAALALLVLAAVPAVGAAALYLVTFGAGTILGMTLVTAAMSAPLLAAAQRARHTAHVVRVGAGAISLAFGLALAHEIGVERQLFGAEPVWHAE
jgi:hypothetical protein